MVKLTKRTARTLILSVLVAAVAGCGLPRFGPNKREITAVESQRYGATEIVVVNDHVTRAVALPREPGFPKSFINAGATAPDRIQPGDTLSFVIYENVDDGVLSRGDSASSTLQSIQVDGDGFIFIPYAGRIRASGNTPEGLRRIITEKLGLQTPEPQVLVQRATGDGATVSILGDGIGGQGVYPLQRSSRRLMEMLATAGGINVAPEVARITVLRRNVKGVIWFEDVYDHPEYDIALHAGDRVLVQRDPRVFTVLGATGAQAIVPFGRRDLSALEALAQAGGLNGAVADPTGLFVIRNQDAEIAGKVLGRPNIDGDKSIVYVLDLTKPNGIPLARNFDMRDGDTIYVTEAPYVQWTKVISAFLGTVGAVQTATSAANTLSGSGQVSTNGSTSSPTAVDSVAGTGG